MTMIMMMTPGIFNASHMELGRFDKKTLKNQYCIPIIPHAG